MSKILGFFFVFIINPLLGIFLSMRSALASKSARLCVPFIVFCSLYMGALNSTKVPISDEENYVMQYKLVPRNGYITTLKYLSGENDRIKGPLYGTFVYIMFYLTFGCEYLFIALVSFLIYFFFFYSIYKFQKRCKTPNYIIVAGVLTVTFFTQYFTLTAHLIRQMLATSIFLYALTFKGLNWKYYVTLLATSFFIHNSMIALVILSLIPSIDKYYSKKRLALLGVLAVVTTAMISTIASFLLHQIVFGDGEVGIAVTKASEAVGLTDAGEGISQAIVMLVSLPLLGISLWGGMKKTTLAPPLILNVCFIWTIFVLGLSFSPLIQYRFFYVLYYFIPIVLFLIWRNNKSLSKLYCSIICIYMVLRFFLTYNTGGFQYTSPLNAIFLPFPLLLNY